jgi:hypothetical protein
MKICVTFTLTHPRGKAVYITNHCPTIRRIGGDIKVFFLVKADSGAKHPAKKAILVTLTQQLAGAMHSGAQENGEKTAMPHSILNPSAAIMDKHPTACISAQWSYSMQGHLLLNFAPTDLIRPR